MSKSNIFRYSLILSTVIFSANPTSVGAQNTGHPHAVEAKDLINTVNQAEQGYYLETGKFTQNLNDLQLTPSARFHKYQLKIADDQSLIQTNAVPLRKKGLRTFTGAVSYHQGIFNSILCKSDRPVKVSPGPIKLVEGRLQCPSEFKIAIHNAQAEAMGSVGATNRAQQAHFLESQSFAKNHVELGFTPSNTYFDYQINLSENGELAQTTASPRFNHLNAYIGATFYVKQTGNYQSITCESKQPTKKITQTIKLVDDQLVCPNEFRVLSP
jgi:hypothetical protein